MSAMSVSSALTVIFSPPMKTMVVGIGLLRRVRIETNHAGRLGLDGRPGRWQWKPAVLAARRRGRNKSWSTNTRSGSRHHRTTDRVDAVPLAPEISLRARSGDVRAGVLRVLLFTVGHGLAVASRFDPALRSRITRSFTLEVSAGERVARQWRFDGFRRRITTRAGAAVAPEHALRFARAGDALRGLLSRRTIDHIVVGTQRGSVLLEGNAAVMMWFFGVTRRLVAIG